MTKPVDNPWELPIMRNAKFFMIEGPYFPNAECIGAPQDLFFPDQWGRGFQRHEETLQLARQYCDVCTHKETCFEWGVRTDSYGIWGGELLSEFINRKIRRERGWLPYGYDAVQS
jgi:hypothetical protein